MKFKLLLLVFGITMIHTISMEVLRCYQCENCSTVTKADLKDCKSNDNDICQIIYKHGNVSRHCLDNTGEFAMEKCQDGQCFCEPEEDETGKKLPCNDNTMFEDLCAKDKHFKDQFSAVCPSVSPDPSSNTSTVIIAVVAVVVVLVLIAGVVIFVVKKRARGNGYSTTGDS